MNNDLKQAEEAVAESANIIRTQRSQIASMRQCLRDMEEDHALLIVKRDLLAKRVRREVEDYEGAEAAK